MNNDKSMLDIFLPVYNEEGCISNNLETLFEFLESIENRDINVIVVNDNSSDSTLDELLSVEVQLPISIVNFKSGPSRRENLCIAMRKSKSPYVLFMDFDLPFALDCLKLIIADLTSGKDVVIGSRYIEGSKIVRKWDRLLISRFYNGFMRIFFGSKIRDHQCGLKAFRTPVFLKLSEKVGIDYSYKRGWFLDVEILLWAQKYDFEVSEIPVNWKYREKSSFSIMREIKMIPKIFELRSKLKRD